MKDQWDETKSSNIKGEQHKFSNSASRTGTTVRSILGPRINNSIRKLQFNESSLDEIPSFSDFTSRTEQGSETSITSKVENLDKDGHHKDLAGTLMSITENIETMPECGYIHSYMIDAEWYRNLYSIFLVSNKTKINRAAYRSSVSVFLERSRHLSTFPHIIHPYSIFRWYWDILLTIFLLITLIIEPIRMTFYSMNLKNESEHLKITIVITIVFILDILLNFLTGWVNSRNDIVTLDPFLIARNYICSWFIIDFLSTIPFDLIYIGVHAGNPEEEYMGFYKSVRILELLKLFRLPRVIRYLTRIQLANQIYGLYVRFINLLIIVFFLTHWLACLHYLIPDLTNESLKEKKLKSWITRNELWNSTISDKYIMALHRTISLELLVGLGSESTREVEELICNMISILCGLTCIAFFIGHISAILMSSGVSERKYTEVINQVKEYLRFKQISIELQDRVLLFYEKRYQRNYFNEQIILDSVSDVLRQDIQLYNYRRLVERVPIFNGLPTSAVYSVVDHLQFQLYLPLDMIITIGTVGDSMYFIEHGMVSILAENGKALGHLRDGDFFGELALISNEKRVASVVATSECGICRLERDDFTQAIKGYPEIFERILNIAQTRKDTWKQLSEIPKHLESKTNIKSKSLYTTQSKVASHAPSGIYHE